MNTRLLIAFMIILMLSSCKTDEVTTVFVQGHELAAYTTFMKDYEVPTINWGYIDRAGQEVIPKQYDHARDFSEGKAAVCRDGLWTYIDKTGKSIIPSRYSAALEFSQDRGVVETWGRGFLLYDGMGQIVSDTLAYDEIGTYQNGLARVKKGEWYGYIDLSGQPVDSLQYTKASQYQDGYAIVYDAQGVHLIDNEQTTILSVTGQGDRIYPPVGDMVRVKTDRKVNYYNLKSKSFFHTEFVKGSDYYNGRALVFDGHAYNLITKSGSITTLPYTDVSVGGEGKWKYSSGGKFGYLNNDGSILTLPNHHTATRYSDGMAAVEVDGLWGYVDENGTLAIDYKLPLAWDFNKGVSRMISREGYGLMDKTGAYILPPKYIELRNYSEGLARVQG